MRNALRVVLLVAFAAAALVVLRERAGATFHPTGHPAARSGTEPPASEPATTAPRRGIPLAEAIAGSVPPRFNRAPATFFEGCSFGGQRSPSEFDAAISRSSWPREQWDKVCRVVACESMWRADAQRSARRGAVRYLGYLQIEDRSWRAQYNAMGFDDAAMLTPLPNLQVGYWLWSSVGGSRWSSAQWDCAGA